MPEKGIKARQTYFTDVTLYHNISHAERGTTLIHKEILRRGIQELPALLRMTFDVVPSRSIFKALRNVSYFIRQLLILRNNCNK
jgi:hypothetical protein